MTNIGILNIIIYKLSHLHKFNLVIWFEIYNNLKTGLYSAVLPFYSIIGLGVWLILIFLILLYSNLSIDKNLALLFYSKLIKIKKYSFIILFYYFVWPLIWR